MTLLNTVFNEVDELRGRLSAIMVNFPDTEVRMRPAIDVLDSLLTKPTDYVIEQTVEELMDLRIYFQDIVKHCPDVHPKFAPSIALIDRLLGPNEVVH